MKRNRRSLYTAGAILLSVVVLLLFIDPPFFRESTERPVSHELPPLRKDARVTFLAADFQKVKAEIDVQIADFENERLQGMMFRKSLGENEGMLFIFERSEPRSFWMKNTFLSLDILYADENGTIISIHHRTEPLSTAPIRSGGDAMYVVETRGGFCGKYDIVDGDLISIDRY